MVDITAQKHAEERLRASLEELRRMVDQRRELAQLLETAQEEERRRIAADIHDDPIQVMSAVDMRLQLLLERPERADAHELGELAEELRSGIDRLRNLLFELRPVALDLEGLARRSGCTSSTRPRRPDGPGRWTTGSRRSRPKKRVAFYRIAQEAVGNVQKHANATHVAVSLTPVDRAPAADRRRRGRVRSRGRRSPATSASRPSRSGRSWRVDGAVWRAGPAKAPCSSADAAGSAGREP